MNERDLLRAYPAYAPYQEELREIFEELPGAFIRRFPALAASWEPFLMHLLERDFDIDHLRKAASDIRDFQQWLVNKNVDPLSMSPGLIKEFVRDLRARFRKRNHHPMDLRTILDVCQGIECFLTFAVHQNRSKPPDPGSAP